MSKLYRARIEAEVVFVADDDQDADCIAEEMLREEVDDNGVNATGQGVLRIDPIRSISEVPPGWLHCIPRNGSADDKQCRDFFIEEAEALGEPRK